MTALAALIGSSAQMLTPTRENGAGLQRWIARGRKADLPHLHSFARGLELDIQAVTAALTLPFHNGCTEGVNIIKTEVIKEKCTIGRAASCCATEYSVTTKSATEPLLLQFRSW